MVETEPWRSSRGNRDKPVCRTALIFCEPTRGSAAVTPPRLPPPWQNVEANSIERFRWLAAVRSFAAVVIRGNSVQWCCDALGALNSDAPHSVVVLAPAQPGVQEHLLDSGADYVLANDCDPGLLDAAVRAVRRPAQSGAAALRYLEAADLRLDVWSRSVTVGEQLVSLTRTEFELLQLLMTRAQTTVSHHEIIKAVWNWKYTSERNALRLQINRLRQKLAVGAEPRHYIDSVRGFGYTFIESVYQRADVHSPVRQVGQGEGSEDLAFSYLRRINEALYRAADRTEAVQLLIQAVTDDGLCDAAAAFARDRSTDLLRLIASHGNSAQWIDEVSPGVPLAGPYVASDTVRSERILHFVDVSSVAKRFGGTARLLRADTLASQLSVPLRGRDSAWGQIGFARRGDSPFTAVHCAVLESAAQLLGALFADSPHPLSQAG